jgi:hypothetical protein
MAVTGGMIGTTDEAKIGPVIEAVKATPRRGHAAVSSRTP